jgi:hypothetical protein
LFSSVCILARNAEAGYVNVGIYQGLAQLQQVHNLLGQSLPPSQVIRRDTVRIKKKV